jgi:tetratricopeptide (TPR) repeat protein
VKTLLILILTVVPTVSVFAQSASDASVPAEKSLSLMAADDGAAEAMEEELSAEKKHLNRLLKELEAIESAPRPSDEQNPADAKNPTGTNTPRESPLLKPRKQPLPDKAIAGAEEELANTLYELGEFKKALVIYGEIVDSEPDEGRLAWAMLQVGNCARKTGDHMSASKAYDALSAKFPANPWAAEATWWSQQVNWWLRWQAAQRNKVKQVGSVATAGKTGI